MANNSLERFGEVPPENLEELENESDNETYHNDGRILSISIWANSLSWVILILYALSFIATMIDASQNTSSSIYSTSFFTLSGFRAWISLLSSPAVGFMFFLILQAISQGILFLMDIYEKILQKSDSQNQP